MFRMTHSRDEAGLTVFEFEGKLVSSCLDDVRRSLDLNSWSVHDLRLDLAGLSYVDAAGARFLTDLLEQGARVDACSGYLHELLGLSSIS